MNANFGKFRLIKRIGGGRLSQVFCIKGLSSEGPAPNVALKRVNPSLIGDPDFVQLVVREAGLLARLSHPNLCLCQEMGVIDGCAFFTLDLVDGCTLRALMRRLSRLGVKLPASAVLALGYQLASVLDYLHNQCETPLVHMDLSPQNVMLSREGDLRLIDFGIARYLDGHNPPPVGRKIAGTIGYMSPEQARGDSVDQKADQFSLGILLWEMLRGRRLFKGNTGKTWKRMRRGDTPSVESALTEAPEPLRKLVQTLLQPDPLHRFDRMAEPLEFMEQNFSSFKSGRRPLAALVQRLMDDREFDPFDVVMSAEKVGSEVDIPSGESAAEDYAEINIEVDFGEGTPSSLLRAVIPEGTELPESPFLKDIPESDDEL